MGMSRHFRRGARDDILVEDEPVADLSDDSPMLDAGFYEQLGDEEQSAAEASGDD
jgi:hypothetical protein